MRTVCLQKEECPQISELYTRAVSETDSQVKASLISELKSQVCNKEEQRFHCTLSVAQSCVARHQCPAVLEKYRIVEEETNTVRRNSTIAELKSLVWVCS